MEFDAVMDGTSVYRGSEIDSDHFILESKFEIPHKNKDTGTK
jgi:hypothetical protein